CPGGGPLQRDCRLWLRTHGVPGQERAVSADDLHDGATRTGDDDSGLRALPLARLVRDLSAADRSGLLRRAVLHLSAGPVLPPPPERVFGGGARGWGRRVDDLLAGPPAALQARSGDLRPVSVFGNLERLLRPAPLYQRFAPLHAGLRLAAVSGRSQ